MYENEKIATLDDIDRWTFNNNKIVSVKNIMFYNIS